MATRLDSGRCVKCDNVLIEIDPPLQMCSSCLKWAEGKAREKIANRKQVNPENLKNRRRLKVGMLK